MSEGEEDEQLITVLVPRGGQMKLTGVTLLFCCAKARPGLQGVD